MPSPPDVTVIVPSAILTLSFPHIELPTDVAVIVPEAIFRSSLDTIAWLMLPSTVSEPLPFIVRSLLLNIAESTLLSSLLALYAEPSAILFSVPFASVTKTLSAFLTYKAE